MPLGPFDPIPPREKIRRSHINDLRVALTGIQDAYDVAVANGFTGTRGQWLQSLVGPPGAGLAPIGSAETYEALPATGNTEGDVRTVDADGRAYRWDGSAWVDIGLFRGPPGDLSKSVADTLYPDKAATEAALGRLTTQHYDVRAYGASTASADNTAALNAAYVAANAAGGGEIVVPPGTWIVRPSSSASRWIKVLSNVSMRMMPGARIKVADDAGDYEYLFSGSAGPSSRVENASFVGLTIDHNASGNTTANVSAGGVGKGQATFRFDNFANLDFDRITLDPYTGVNPFQLYGSSNDSYGVRITNGRFIFERAASTSDYDTSTIYASAAHVTVTDNQFLFFGADVDFPDGAIEIHGPHQVVSGNLVYRFGVGTWCVPNTGATTNRLAMAAIITDNAYLSCGYGVGVFAAGGTQPLRGVNVADNLVHIDSARFARKVQHAGVSVAGNGTTIAAEDVSVDNNTIIYEPDTRTIATGGGTVLWGSIGALTLRGSTGASTRRVTFTNNRVYNAPGVGLTIRGGAGTVYEDVWAHHNLFVDCGSNASLADSSRVAIDMQAAGDYRRVVLEDNRVTDTGSAALVGKYAWRIPTLTGAEQDVTFRRNEHKATAGALLTTLDEATVITGAIRTAIDFPSIAAGTSAEIAVTVKGARYDRDAAFASPISFSGGVNAGLVWSAYVSGDDTVRVRMVNPTDAAIDAANRQWIVGYHRRQP